ncbi:hypothetical protein I316_07077 [Kwoniella heveanensis BCC8398]|uniref:Uncharacterized protein n=1 Tax=Kwoniella heveanensis BCC8398 TaxID=1296120 RepID=A0A1B9GJW4_9TREE|nr:hypothetical protein I316_07077 [Kwoniella heveanensis BCC8398]
MEGYSEAHPGKDEGDSFAETLSKMTDPAEAMEKAVARALVKLGKINETEFGIWSRTLSSQLDDLRNLPLRSSVEDICSAFGKFKKTQNYCRRITRRPYVRHTQDRSFEGTRAGQSASQGFTNAVSNESGPANPYPTSGLPSIDAWDQQIPLFSSVQYSHPAASEEVVTQDPETIAEQTDAVLRRNQQFSDNLDTLKRDPGRNMQELDYLISTNQLPSRFTQTQ